MPFIGKLQPVRYLAVLSISLLESPHEIKDRSFRTAEIPFSPKPQAFKIALNYLSKPFTVLFYFRFLGIDQNHQPKRFFFQCTNYALRISWILLEDVLTLLGR